MSKISNRPMHVFAYVTNEENGSGEPMAAENIVDIIHDCLSGRLVRSVQKSGPISDILISVCNPAQYMTRKYG